MSHQAWIQTVEGKAFFFLEPKLEDITLSTIAHCLARECRWGNQLPEFYSVAEHSVRVSYACDPKDALWGLLHDASEAYLIDIPTPIKRYLRFGIGEMIERLRPILLACIPDDPIVRKHAPEDADQTRIDVSERIIEHLRIACPDMLGYDELERRIMKSVCEKFNLAPTMPESVAYADAVLLVTEKRDLCLPPPLPWGPPHAPLKEKIRPWSETNAKAKFIRRFYELTGVRRA